MSAPTTVIVHPNMFNMYKLKGTTTKILEAQQGDRSMKIQHDSCCPQIQSKKQQPAQSRKRQSSESASVPAPAPAKRARNQPANQKQQPKGPEQQTKSPMANRELEAIKPGKQKRKSSGEDRDEEKLDALVAKYRKKFLGGDDVKEEKNRWFE